MKRNITAKAILLTITATLPVTAGALPAQARPPVIIGIIAPKPAVFAATADIRLSVAVRFIGWGTLPPGPPPAGQRLLAEISPPAAVTFTAIASGHADTWLARLGRALHVFPGVTLAFAAEANAWGKNRPFWPASYKAAYNRVCRIVAVPCIWQISHWLTPWTIPLTALWPGRSHVTSVGIDGFPAGPGDTYATVFAPAVAAVRTLDPGVPVFLASAGIAQNNRTSALAGLVAGARADSLTGLIYFNCQQWALTPAETAAYGADIRKWTS